MEMLRKRSKRRTESSDEEKSEDNEDGVASVSIRGSNGGDTDDELAHAHPESTVEEELSSTDLLDHVDTGESGADVDNTGSDGDEVGRSDTGSLEVRGTVVEDEVDTRELLGVVGLSVEALMRMRNGKVLTCWNI